MSAPGLVFIGGQEILADFDRFLARVNEPEAVIGPVLARLHARVLERIQQRGQATDGQLIGGGRYSKQAMAERRKLGRQVSFIDLTLTGAMLNMGFESGPALGGGFGLGFVDKLSADKMEWLEKHFNQSIIAPSEDELAETFADLLNAFKNEAE